MENIKGKGNLGLGLLVVVLVGAAFAIGRLSAQVEYLSKGGTTAGVQTSPTGGAPAAAAPKTSVLAVESLKKYAKDLKLDTKKFNSCLDDGKYAQKVKDDQAYGQSIGVGGTPSFVINDVFVVGAVPQTVFEDVIDFELAGGDWSKPSEKVAYLVDKNEQNIEVVLDKTVETGKGYITGGKGAKVKIVEFSDFECPFCARYYPTYKSLQSKYGDKISTEFRHFPLTFHPNAQKAAEAAECAGEQNKFWEMHDKLFELQQS